MPYGISWKTFAFDLRREVKKDLISTQAAALGFYLMLAIFPAMIALLSLLPYLPIENLESSIMGHLRQALPGEAAEMFTRTVREVTTVRRGGLLSLGLLLTLWTASSGTYAVIEQVNRAYGSADARPFWKKRALAVLLAVLFGGLIVGAFALIVLGGRLQAYLADTLGWNEAWLIASAALRWLVILSAVVTAFSLTYHFSSGQPRRFRWITPGSVAGTALLVLASVGFKIYVENFGKYDATYGSIGAVIVLMLCLYLLGFVVLIGAEVNALLDRRRTGPTPTRPRAYRRRLLPGGI